MHGSNEIGGGPQAETDGTNELKSSYDSLGECFRFVVRAVGLAEAGTVM